MKFLSFPKSTRSQSVYFNPPKLKRGSVPVFKDISISSWRYDECVLIFGTECYKIVEILALLAAELSSSKIYEVSMLFYIQCALF